MTKNVRNNVDQTCVSKKLGPWLGVLVVLIIASVIAVYYFADDISQAQQNRIKMQQSPDKPWQTKIQVTGQNNNAAVGLGPFWQNTLQPNAVAGVADRTMSFNQAIDVVLPSVVGIKTSGGQTQNGSEVIVHRIGYVLTNNHVVEGAKNIIVTVMVDQVVRKTYPAKVVEVRGELDLALLRLESTNDRIFPPAPLGDSGHVEVGWQIIVVGNPFGLAQSASYGIVSNPRRHLTTTDNREFKDLIQVDASLNPGASGGALINTYGEVIGISTAVYSPVQAFTGIGFAVPINQAKAAFGTRLQDIPSPLVKINSQARVNNAAFRRNNRNTMLSSANPAFQTVAAATTPTGTLPSPSEQNAAGKEFIEGHWLGLEVIPLTPELAKEYQIPKGQTGVLVDEITLESAESGILAGDMVQSIGGFPTPDLKGFFSGHAACAGTKASSGGSQPSWQQKDI